MKLIVCIRRRQTGEKGGALGIRKRWLRRRKIATPIIASATTAAAAAAAAAAAIVDIAIVAAVAAMGLVAATDGSVEFRHGLVGFARSMLLRLRMRPMSDEAAIGETKKY